MSTPDVDLVERCLRGDEGAWEQIVHQYHSRIYNVAYRYTARFDEAEDLTQEIFLKVYRTLGSYRAEVGTLVTWMIRVGRNHIIDHYRKHKTERSQTDSIDLDYERAEQNPARYPTPAEALEKSQLSARVHQGLMRITPELREAVILRDLEEFTYEEIADMLQVPIGTVKSRINRGRTELARVLGRIKGQL